MRNANVGARPHKNDAAVNPEVAMISNRLRPRWFASHPVMGRITAFATRYDVSAQVASSTLAERLPAICGSDTFTTVVSSTSINVLNITDTAMIHGLISPTAGWIAIFRASDRRTRRKDLPAVRLLLLKKSDVEIALPGHGVPFDQQSSAASLQSCAGVIALPDSENHLEVPSRTWRSNSSRTSLDAPSPEISVFPLGSRTETRRPSGMPFFTWRMVTVTSSPDLMAALLQPTFVMLTGF